MPCPAILRVALFTALLTASGCASSVGASDGGPGDAPGDASGDASSDAFDVGICTGVCFAGPDCVNGARQTGQGHCQGGSWVCETVPCADDGGAPHD